MKCAERENGKYISIFRLECEDMNSINQAHCYIVSIRGTLLIHQLSYKLILILYWLNWFCKRKRYWHNQNQAGFLIHLKFKWRDGFPILWLYHMFFYFYRQFLIFPRFIEWWCCWWKCLGTFLPLEIFLDKIFRTGVNKWCVNTLAEFYIFIFLNRILGLYITYAFLLVYTWI